jgi:hypothetical protein
MVNPQNRPFYLVSLGKLALLFFATMGLYSLAWFYLHWQAQNNTQSKKVFSIPRSIFSIFFIGDLCNRLRLEQQKQAVEYLWSPQRLSLVFVAVVILQNALEMAVRLGSLDPGWLFLWAFLLLPVFYVFYQFQLVANRVMGDPFGNANRTITPINALWIGFGVFMWCGLLFSLAGIAPPVPPPTE